MGTEPKAVSRQTRHHQCPPLATSKLLCKRVIETKQNKAKQNKAKAPKKQRKENEEKNNTNEEDTHLHREVASGNMVRSAAAERQNECPGDSE